MQTASISKQVTESMNASDIMHPHPAPRGALLYGEPGTCHVWEHSNTGRKRWDFDDEYLAMQCAVRLGSVVEANSGSQP